MMKRILTPTDFKGTIAEIYQIKEFFSPHPDIEPEYRMSWGVPKPATRGRVKTGHFVKIKILFFFLFLLLFSVIF